jgi:hypothetical protein
MSDAPGELEMEFELIAALLIGCLFTFSGTASRFEDRRHLVAEETNAIGTAYLRLDLLSADTQPDLRDLFRRYVDTRANTYQNAGDRNATNAKLAETAACKGSSGNRR